MNIIEFTFENHELAFLSILEYETIDADFSDILIGLINNQKGCTITYSFDEKAAKTKYFQEM